MSRRHSFDDLARDYDRHDFLVREIDRRMQERLDFIRWRPARILDLGCACGGSRVALKQHYPEAQWLGLDRSAAMLRRLAASGDAVQADVAALPLPSATIGLVWSNLLLHWLPDIRPVLQEVWRVLEVGGLFMASTLGPDTLKEWRMAFSDARAPVLSFADMHDLGDSLCASGFADCVVDREDLTLTYDSWAAMVQELRQSTPASPAAKRRHGLMTPAHWARVEAAYPRRGGKWPVTVELIYCHAWKETTKASGHEHPLVPWRR